MTTSSTANGFDTWRADNGDHGVIVAYFDDNFELAPTLTATWAKLRSARDGSEFYVQLARCTLNRTFQAEASDVRHH